MTQLNYDGNLKSLRETLCCAQTAISRREYDREYIERDVERLERLIDEIDQLRPLGPDGKHEDRHTNACGCENVVRTQTPNEKVIISELLEALRLTVEYVGTDVLKPIPGWSWYDTLMKYAPHVAFDFKEREEWRVSQRNEHVTYPYRKGDMIVLGPDTVVRLDRSVICHRGVEYYSEEPNPEHVRAWTQWLADHGAGRNGVAETLVRAGVEIPDD